MNRSVTDDQGSRVGLCRFRDLPQRYQEALNQGTLHQLEGHFFSAQQDLFVASLTAFFGLLILGIPGSLTMMLGIMVLAQEMRRMIQGSQSLGAGLIVIGLGLSMSLFAYLCLFKPGLASLRLLLASYRVKRSQPQNIHHYGLLLTDEDLVIRHVDYLQPFTCAWIPKDRIESCHLRQMAEHRGKKTYFIEVMGVLYQSKQGQSKELIVREDHFGSLKNLHQSTQRWLQAER
ncbi:MAG: hypothetical protein ACFCU9_02835 [Cyanophyceae cyanobacterium]